MKTLRPHQSEAISALYNYWNQPDSGHGLIVIPTGGGKSLLMAAIIKDISEKWPGTRILVLAHVKELIQQTHDEIQQYWPAAPVGIFSAGIGRKELQAPILIAGIQSIAAHAHKMSPPPEIVLVDECHLIPRNESTRYLSTIKLLTQMYPHLKVVGLSATPYRLDSGWLHHGDGAIFDRIVYDVPVQSLIDQGYLCSVYPKNPDAHIDANGVRHSGKEYVAGELEQHVLDSGTTPAAVADMLERAKDRKKWLIFACGVKHALEIKSLLEAEGIPTGIITGETPKSERDGLIQDFKGGTLTPIRALCNVNVLTTGFNVPAVDFIALMRPTESVGLYVQMVGRGMRTAPGKTDCLVADYAGLTLRHGPIDAVDPSRTPFDGDGVAPAKECPECQTIIHAAIRICPVCGFIFPVNDIQIKTTPTEAPILKAQIEPEEIVVSYTEYSIHKKEGKKDSVRIIYSHGLGTVSEWVFPEANTQWGNFYYRKFCKEMGMTEPYPVDADGFVARPDLRSAVRIWTVAEGKYDRVKRHEWGGLVKSYEDSVPF